MRQRSLFQLSVCSTPRCTNCCTLLSYMWIDLNLIVWCWSFSGEWEDSKRYCYSWSLCIASSTFLWSTRNSHYQFLSHCSSLLSVLDSCGNGGIYQRWGLLSWKKSILAMSMRPYLSELAIKLLHRSTILCKRLFMSTHGIGKFKVEHIIVILHMYNRTS